MECYARQVNGSWHAVFKCRSQRFTSSLRTRDEEEAKVRIGRIREAVYRIETGTLDVPDGIDLKAFVVAGGRVTEEVKPTPKATLGELSDLYLAAMRNLEENSRLTIRIHLAHAARILGAKTPLGKVGVAAVESYATARLAERTKKKSGPDDLGRPILAYTIKKELTTLRAALDWAARVGHASGPPAWTTRSVSLPKDKGRQPFRTYEQITDLMRNRGGAFGKDEDPWECLYLTGPEIRDLLAYVKKKASDPWVYAMFAFVAMTGCRRSEMARSLREDWDLENRRLHIREKKRNRGKEITFREIDVHEELATAMREWFAVHPGGPWTITANGGKTRIDTATTRFKKILAGHTKWSRIRGFHVLRHSLASVLASEGVDPRRIDGLMGHQTTQMRLRYQHLIPTKVRREIDRLFGPSEGGGHGSDTGPAPNGGSPNP